MSFIGPIHATCPVIIEFTGFCSSSNMILVASFFLFFFMEKELSGASLTCWFCFPALVQHLFVLCNCSAPNSELTLLYYNYEQFLSKMANFKYQDLNLKSHGFGSHTKHVIWTSQPFLIVESQLFTHSYRLGTVTATNSVTETQQFWPSIMPLWRSQRWQGGTEAQQVRITQAVWKGHGWIIDMWKTCILTIYTKKATQIKCK